MLDARGWLATERKLIDGGDWLAPTVRNRAQPTTLAAYSAQWLDRTDGRRQPLKPRTRDLYKRLLEQKITPTLGDLPLKAITPFVVREWYATLDPALPTRRAHAYALLRTILGWAVSDELIAVNPCNIRNAGSHTKRVHKIKPATLGELEAIVAALPDRYGVMVLLASWCALRFGELTELRRSDVDLKAGKVMVRRAVTWVDGEPIVGAPKSDAGVRDVAIPPHLLPVVRQHLADHAAWGRDGLLFPAPMSEKQLGHGTFFKTWDKARTGAGRPDLRFHDLRHTGATLAAQTGATLAELMSRLGHSTTAAAMLYQHAATDRDTEIARLLSRMVEV
nr:site-specific integrase [Microlunatus antarcticus]